MKFTALFTLLTLATATAASHYCLGGCVKCYCGDIQYDDHICKFCTCNEDAYKSANTTNPQGTCDKGDGFHLGCGTKFNGKCI